MEAVINVSSMEESGAEARSGQAGQPGVVGRLPAVLGRDEGVLAEACTNPTEYCNSVFDCYRFQRFVYRDVGVLAVSALHIVECRRSSSAPWRTVPVVKYTLKDIKDLNAIYGYEKYRVRQEPAE